MRTRRTVVPDSEDDAVDSGTSLRDSSPLRQLESLSQGERSHSMSRTTRVIQDSEDEGDLGLDMSDPVTSNKPASGNVEVVIPAKKDESLSDSTRSSLGIPSADGATGSNTPATSVGAAADSDTKKPRARVNATARVQQLQANKTSRQTEQRGTKRSAGAMAADEQDDEEEEDPDLALARALQMEEYEEPPSKRPKTQPQRGGRQSQGSRGKFIVSQSPISDETDLTSPDSLTSESEEAFSSGNESDATEDEHAGAFQGRTPAFPAESDRHVVGIRNQGPVVYDEDSDAEHLSWEERRKARRVCSEHPSTPV